MKYRISKPAAVVTRLRLDIAEITDSQQSTLLDVTVEHRMLYSACSTARSFSWAAWDDMTYDLDYLNMWETAGPRVTVLCKFPTQRRKVARR